MNNRLICGAVASLAFVACARAGHQTIALRGQDAPGTGGQYGNLLGTISVAGNGDIVFWSTIDGVPNSQDTGAFKVVDGVISKIIQQGDEAPGLGGPVLDQVSGPILSDSGVFSINLRLDTGGDITFDNDWGLWADFGSGLTRIAQEGAEAPGLSGALFDRPGDGLLSSGGDLLFFNRLKEGTGGVTSDNNDSLWRRVRGESLEMLAREGDMAPGIDGAAFRFLNLGSINASGDALLPATVQATGALRRGEINFDNDDALWLTKGSGLTLVAREGDLAPDTGGGAYGSFQYPQLSDSGEFVFSSEVTFPDIAPRGIERDWVLFMTENGTPEPVAFADTPAPGAEDKVLGLFLWPRINAQNDLVFGAYLNDPDGEGDTDRGFIDQGLWIRRGGSEDIEPIAITGATAPETDGARFADFVSPVIGPTGDVIFRANLINEGDVTFDNSSGIWAHLAPEEGRGVGQTIKIVRKGDAFEVGPGDVRIIDFVDFEGANVEANEPSQAFNGMGQLGVRISFTDGSGGIFLFDVPTPGSAALLAMGGLLAMRRKR